jgi:hypothetical protein
MTTWNGCKLIYENGKLQDSLPGDIHYTLLRYYNKIGKPREHNIWYDAEEKKCFGQDLTWLNSNSKESFFISDKRNFLNGNRWNKEYVLNYYGSIFGDNIVQNDEIIYKDSPDLKKFKNSKILIVGGGPTANLCDWNPEEYDFVWSCNHFFLNEKLNKLDLGLVMLGTEVDLSNDNVKLHEYLQNSTSAICFEDRFSEGHKQNLEFMNEKYADRCVYAHTRYRGKVGCMPRLLCIATLFGAKEIHFVGMDGMAKETKRGDLHSHAFQKEKRYTMVSLNYNMYRRHYVAFWDYMLNGLKTYGKIKYQNLGEGHPKNQTTDISRQMFPLKTS